MKRKIPEGEKSKEKKQKTDKGIQESPLPYSEMITSIAMACNGATHKVLLYDISKIIAEFAYPDLSPSFGKTASRVLGEDNIPLHVKVFDRTPSCAYASLRIAIAVEIKLWRITETDRNAVYCRDVSTLAFYFYKRAADAGDSHSRDYVSSWKLLIGRPLVQRWKELRNPIAMCCVQYAAETYKFTPAICALAYFRSKFKWSTEKANDLLEEAVAAGDYMAMKLTCLLNESNHRRRFELSKVSADMGYPPAQALVALYYSRHPLTKCAVWADLPDKDDVKAVRYARMSKEIEITQGCSGIVGSIILLAEFYESGRGNVEIDIKLAIEHYKITLKWPALGISEMINQPNMIRPVLILLVLCTIGVSSVKAEQPLPRLMRFGMMEEWERCYVDFRDRWSEGWRFVRSQYNAENATTDMWNWWDQAYRVPEQYRHRFCPCACGYCPFGMLGGFEQLGYVLCEANSEFDAAVEQLKQVPIASKLFEAYYRHSFRAHWGDLAMYGNQEQKEVFSHEIVAASVRRDQRMLEEYITRNEDTRRSLSEQVAQTQESISRLISEQTKELFEVIKSFNITLDQGPDNSTGSHIDWCLPTHNPPVCLNGGVCMNSVTQKGAVCHCPAPFIGATCQLINGTDYCDSLNNKCQNGATCHNVYNNQTPGFGYICLCPVGYTGDHCQTPIE